MLEDATKTRVRVKIQFGTVSIPRNKFIHKIAGEISSSLNKIYIKPLHPGYVVFGTSDILRQLLKSNSPNQILDHTRPRSGS